MCVSGSEQDDWFIRTMYATKRRRRTVKSVKTPSKEPPKSNPSKRHRERLNGELDHLASLLPFEQSVISKLDKLSILRLAVSYLRTKSFFQTVLPARYGIESHLMSRSHLFHEPGFSEGESILQALYGFLFVVTCEGEVFFASRTVEQYLGFHQSDIIHQSVMELIHSEDRDEFKRQLTWSSLLPADKVGMALHDVMLPENVNHLHRSFTVRFRCLLDNTSGFITLEINGWIRVLHRQNPRCEEPQLALFATCSPFGPLSLFDIPSREMTFKTKHKMDFSPVTMDNRGKTIFGYSDQELSTRSGYDLIHPDDLNYFSSAHQELIKTGSSGLISYRWHTKHFHWLWLQSSCKVIYKNSKPDFIICTHRQLTEDEGQNLYGKRGNEFKLPYPLLDIDVCTGFGFGDDEITTKSKSHKNKKKSGNNAASNGNSTGGTSSNFPSPGGNKECQNGKKRKAACIIGGIPSYSSYTGGFTPYDGGGGEMKSADSLYAYGGNSFGFDNDAYRSQGYSALAPTMYPSSDPYRLDVDKHGYFLDHRQYQHSALPYANNGYSDYVPSSKYGYDMPKYGFDSYSLDLSKRVDCSDISQLHSDVRRYAFDYHHPSYSHLDVHTLHPTDRYTGGRLNVGSLDVPDLRGTAPLYNGNSYMNTVDAPCAVSSPCVASSVMKSVPATSHHLNNKDQSPSKFKLSAGNIDAQASSMTYDVAPHLSLPHNSVIKSTRQQESVLVPSSNSLTHPLGQVNSEGVISQVPGTKSSWSSCSKSVSCLGEQPGITSMSPLGGGHLDVGLAKSGHETGHLANTRECDDNIHKSHDSHLRLQTKDSPLTGIPVSVVKQSSWLHSASINHSDNNNMNGGSLGNISGNNVTTNSNNILFSDRDWHLGLKVFDRGDNPLLSFSEMTHSLMSSSH